MESVPAPDCVSRKRERGYETREGLYDSSPCVDAREGEEDIHDALKPAKRSCSEWTSAEGILSKLLSEDDDDILNSTGENLVDGVALREELVSGVMRSLEEEIERPLKATAGEDIRSASPSAATDIEYLSVASDDELGLPPSPPVFLDEPVFQKPGGDDGLFDQNFSTDYAIRAGDDRVDQEEFLQIRRAADCLFGFDDNEFPSSLLYTDAADWFDTSSELFDPYILC